MRADTLLLCRKQTRILSGKTAWCPPFRGGLIPLNRRRFFKEENLGNNPPRGELQWTKKVLGPVNYQSQDGPQNWLNCQGPIKGILEGGLVSSPYKTGQKAEKGAMPS